MSWLPQLYVISIEREVLRPLSAVVEMIASKILYFSLVGYILFTSYDIYIHTTTLKRTKSHSYQCYRCKTPVIAAAPELDLKRRR